MTYTKPEVAVLGGAAETIQELTKVGRGIDAPGSSKPNQPAYDLDE